MQNIVRRQAELLKVLEESSRPLKETLEEFNKPSCVPIAIPRARTARRNDINVNINIRVISSSPSTKETSDATHLCN